MGQPDFPQDRLNTWMFWLLSGQKGHTKENNGDALHAKLFIVFEMHLCY